MADKKKKLTQEEIWNAAAKKALPVIFPKKVKQMIVSMAIALLGG